MIRPLQLVTRLVYLPAGQWTDFWTGAGFTGPTTVLKLAGPEVMPLYVRAAAQLPAGVSVAALP